MASVVSGLGRRLLAASVPVAAVAYAWASLETGASVRVFAGIAAVAAPAAVPARLTARVVVAVATLGGLTLIAVGRTVGAVRDVVDQGLRDIYAVAPPFVPTTHSELHTLVIVTACAFCLAIAVTAGSRPFFAAAIAAGGIGWPATILPSRNTISMGALALLAALWPIVVSGLRDRRGLVPGAAVSLGIVIVAVVLAGAGARPSVAALDWQNWDLFGESRAGHTVVAVWRSDYGGIDFPPGKTTVLKIKAPRRALYWRATTLDTFASDHWVETLYATGPLGRDQVLPYDPLLPASAALRDGWVKQEVDVRALVDDHVIAAGQPMEIDQIGDKGIRFLSGGVMLTPGGLAGMRRYTVWSYAPTRPRRRCQVASEVPEFPGALSRCRPHRCPGLRRPGRAAAVSSIFHDDLYQQLWAYEPMWRQASRADRRRRGHRTRPRSRSSAGCARPAGSATTSIRRRLPGASARRLPRALQARLLPAVRRDDGPDAALPRHSVPGRRRVHERIVEGRHVDGDRPRRPRLGRGLVRRAWLAAFDPDAGARHVVGDVHERLGLRRRDPGARHRAIPRRGLVRTDDAEAWRGISRSDALRRNPVAPDRPGGADRASYSSDSPF